MNENIDFIVLEQDDGAGCALIAATVEGAVPAIDGYNTPYIVAEGYDHAARDWEDCRLFDDIGKAKLAYEKLRGRDYSLDADMPDSIAFRAKHSDIGTDDYRAKDFYKNAYRLIDDSYTAIAWRSEDRSLVYLAVADRGNELSVLHFPASALEGLDSPALSHEDLFDVLGAVQDLHVGETPMRRATPWPNSPARRGQRHRSGLPCWAGPGMENSILMSSSDSPPTRTRARRGPSADFPTRSWKARSRRRPPRWTPSLAIFAARSCSIGASCCVPKRRAGCTSLAAARWKRGAATRRPWPPRPRRPRLSATAAPSSTEATSISKPAAGNASRRPIR